MKRALFIGRFQPIHKGHLKVIKDQILKRYTQVIIAIGSTQEDYTFKNPFTAEERFTMIKAALEEIGLSSEKYFIVHVPDIPTNSLWPQWVKSLSPSFDVVFTGSPFIKILFELEGIKVIKHKLIDRKNLSGTEIRERMLNNKNWKELVAKSTAKLIEKFDGVNRIKQIVATDNPYKN